MHLYARVYEFAASAGAFEGYVYHREKPDMTALTNWIDNLKAGQALLPQEVLGEIQPLVDRTLGRALQSLVSILGEGHELVRKLRTMTKGQLPVSADDFEKEKSFKKSLQEKGS